MPSDPQLFSIGEFSQISGLSVKALHFYDEKGLLKPAQVDPTSGYRFYDAGSAERARIIARLRELQFSLDDITGVLTACSDDADLLGHLERQRRAIEARIRTDRQASRKLQQMIADEREAAQRVESGEFTVEEKRLEPLLVAGVRMTGRYAECGRGFATIARTFGRHLTGKPLCLYYDGEYRDEDANFEPCLPLRRAVSPAGSIGVQTLPATLALSLIHRGPYDQLGRSYRKILAEARRRRVSVALPTREVYLKGPGMIFKGNPRNYLTEIQLPIAES